MLGDHAHRLGAVVLYGRCEPEPASPYEPFVEALGSYVLTESQDQFDWSHPLAGELVRLMPQLSGRVPSPLNVGAGTDADRYRLFEAVVWLLSVAKKPIVLVLDDLHWAHAPTLLLLRHLTLHPQVDRLLTVGTFRDIEVGPGHPLSELLIRLVADGSAARIDLEGLDVHAVEALLRASAPAEQLADLLPEAHVIREVTGGNPLFVKEILRDLGDGKFDRSYSADLWSIAPRGVGDLVAQRLARLSRSTSAAVRAASVIGQRFSIDLVALATGLDQDVLLESVEEALGVRLIEEVEQQIDHFTFTHAVVRNVIYQSVSASRRVRLHRRVGEGLEELAATQSASRLPELAYHFFESAQTGVADKAAGYCIAAGDLAMGTLEFEEAVIQYRRALGLAVEAMLEEETVGETRLSLGRALEGSGQYSEARETYLQAAETARDLHRGDLLARVAIAFAGPWINVGEVNEQLLSLVHDAKRLADDQNSSLYVQLLDVEGSALANAGTANAERAIAEQALHVSRGLADPAARAAGLAAWRRFLLRDPGQAAKRLELAREIVQVADEAELHDRRLMGRRVMLADLLAAGALEDFDQEFERYSQLAGELHQPTHVWWAKALHATRECLRGRLRHAELIAEDAYKLGQRLQQTDAPGTYILQLFVLRYQQGRLGDVADKVESPISYPSARYSWYALMAIYLAETGRCEDALEVIERLAKHGFETIPRDPFWLSSIAFLADAATRCGARGPMQTLATLLEPFADQAVVVGAGGAVLGVTHHWLGRLAAADRHWADAERHLLAAIDASQAMDAGFWTARAQLDLANVLRDAGSDGPSRFEALAAEAQRYAEAEQNVHMVAQAQLLLRGSTHRT
jgi:tetratricopeptide (TPR) repeat protein